MEEDIRLKVVQYLIKNTPVGEMSDVIRDIRNIVGEEAISTDSVKDAILEHYAYHGHTVEIDGLKFMVTNEGRNEDLFYDPKHNKFFSFDPFTLAAAVHSDCDYTPSEVQVNLQQKLEKYVASYYNDTASVRVFAVEDSFIITLSSNALNLRNLWTGEWLSKWRVGETELMGEVRINAHYFEDGNLQLNQKKGYSQVLSSDFGSEAWLQEVVSDIYNFEDEVHRTIHELYQELQSSCFKSLRRNLPVTHTKFSEIHSNKMLI